MPSIVKEKVTVTELSKYGFKAGKEYINFATLIKESDKGKVVPGAVLEAEMYVADSGMRYLNAVLSTEHKQCVPVVEAPKKSFVAKAVAKAKSDDDKMSKDEWQAKDRRISRQGVIQVAVQVTADFDEAVALAEKMLGFVNQ